MATFTLSSRIIYFCGLSILCLATFLQGAKGFRVSNGTPTTNFFYTTSLAGGYGKRNKSSCDARTDPSKKIRPTRKVFFAANTEPESDHEDTKITQGNKHNGDSVNHHSHEGNAAIHQIDHRVKEKASIALGEKFADGFVKTAERQLERQSQGAASRIIQNVGERSAERAESFFPKWLKAIQKAFGRRSEGVWELGIERTSERVIERAADRGLERTGERVIERAGERIADRAAELTGERLAERAGERIADRAAERTGERLAEKAGERIADRAAERAGERLAERAGERIMDQAGEKMIERAGERIADRAVERFGERLTERTGERLAERAGERAAERTGNKIINKAGERLAERAGERVVDRSTERAGEKILQRSGGNVAERVGEQLVERSGERAVERSGTLAIERTGEKLAGKTGRAIERVFGVSSEKLALRLGRGVLITLPALGGLFALYLLKSDIDRLKEEWSLHVKTSSAFFLGAAIADGIDSILHFFIAFALLKHLSHRHLAVAEELSLGCAIASTVFAVAGEVISLRIQKRHDGSAANTVTAGDKASESPEGNPHQ